MPTVLAVWWEFFLPQITDYSHKKIINGVSVKNRPSRKIIIINCEVLSTSCIRENFLLRSFLIIIMVNLFQSYLMQEACMQVSGCMITCPVLSTEIPHSITRYSATLTCPFIVAKWSGWNPSCRSSDEHLLLLAYTNIIQYISWYSILVY